ncbi:MAG: CoA pyrophosphatase [Acidobacteria bacterium]|nr:CoA pyrophosphatase [Acidobacteriota bacterium]
MKISGKFSEYVRGRLSELSPKHLADGFDRQAAVLMPFFEQNGEMCLLLTRRTDEVETHKGQVSFPGGMCEEGESLERTAIRETFEEIGIAADSIEILGRFHDYITITDVRVTPFAAMLRQPFTVTPQAHEVAEILRVPCSLFLDPKRLFVEKDLIIDGKIAGDYTWFYGPHRIWGLTALIIHDFFKTIQLASFTAPSPTATTR